MKKTWCLVILSFVGCRTITESDVLVFPVQEVADLSETAVVIPEKTHLDECNLLGFQVVGSQMYASSGMTDDYLISIYDLVSGEITGGMCRRGRGPGEFLSVSPSFSIWDGCLSLYDAGTGTYSEIDLDRIRNEKDVFEKRTRIAFPAGGNNPIIMSSFKLPNDLMIAYNSVQGEIGYVSIESPYYAVYDTNTGEQVRQYDIFDARSVNSRADELSRMTSFALADCIDERREKICFAMNQMPILAILDIATGEAHGIRLKNAPAYTIGTPVFHFRSVCADENMIYALYYGEKQEDILPEKTDTILYVFSWEGVMLNKVRLKGLYLSCRADSNKLYLSKLSIDQHTYLYEIDTKTVAYPNPQ